MNTLPIYYFKRTHVTNRAAMHFLFLLLELPKQDMTQHFLKELH